jgi:hypothetical protein
LATWPDVHKAILTELMHDGLYMKKRDPRDVVYGLVQLAWDCEEGSIRVDYSLPLETVLLSAFVNHIKTHRDVAFLSRTKKAGVGRNWLARAVAGGVMVRILDWLTRSNILASYLCGWGYILSQ